MSDDKKFVAVKMTEEMRGQIEVKFGLAFSGLIPEEPFYFVVNEHDKTEWKLLTKDDFHENWAFKTDEKHDMFMAVIPISEAMNTYHFTWLGHARYVDAVSTDAAIMKFREEYHALPNTDRLVINKVKDD